MIEISNLENKNNILQQKEIDSAYCTYKNIQECLLMCKKIINLGYSKIEDVLSEDCLLKMINIKNSKSITNIFHQYRPNSINEFIKLYDIKTQLDLNKPIISILDDILNDVTCVENEKIKVDKRSVYVEFELFQLFHISQDLSNSFCLVYKNKSLSQNQIRQMFENVSLLLLNLTINMINRNKFLRNIALFNFPNISNDYIMKIFSNTCFLNNEIFDFNQFIRCSFNANVSTLSKLDLYFYDDDINDPNNPNNDFIEKYKNLKDHQKVVLDGLMEEERQNLEKHQKFVLILIVFLEFVKNKKYIEQNIMIIKDIEQILIKLSDISDLNKNLVKEYIQSTISILIVLFYNMGIIFNLHTFYEMQLVFIIINKIEFINFSRYPNCKFRFHSLLKQVSKEQLRFKELKKCMFENLENLLNKINHIFQKLKNVKDLDPVIIYIVNSLNASLKTDHTQSFFITFLQKLKRLYDKYKNDEDIYIYDDYDSLNMAIDIIRLKQANTIIYQIYKQQYCQFIGTQNKTILTQNNSKEPEIQKKIKLD